MKIIIIIPAYNEEESILTVLQRIPKEIQGNPVEILVINDGSTDRTEIVAKNAGATVISHPQNMGLGITLKTGLINALKLNADIIVQIDADGQYLPEEIPTLIEPLLENKCDLILGTRFAKIKYKMPFTKRIGNKFISLIVRMLTKTSVTDAQTGFRAFNRKLAEMLKLKLKGTYTYTQEMLIHSAFSGFRIQEIPTTFEKRISGESRLIQSNFSYLKRVTRIILLTVHDYKPLFFYGILATLLILFGLVLLIIDNTISLEGVHLIPAVNLGDADAKTLLTIFLPLGVGFVLILFGILLESIKRMRDAVIESNLLILEQLKKN